MAGESCFHCGDDINDEVIDFEDKKFCCNGCSTVYQILNESDLGTYYDLNQMPGVSPDHKLVNKYDILQDENVREKLLSFADGDIAVVNLYIPSIHCSSCIWLLENLARLQEGVISSQVNFPKKRVRVAFRENEVGLHEVAAMMAALGYAPNINLQDLDEKSEKIDRSLWYKLGVAGFAFGNIMLLALPEYLQMEGVWLDRFRPFFQWIMFTLSLPVVFYSSQDYFNSAYKGLRHKHINIDVPIALGIAVLFLRSTYEIWSGSGSGYFDSLAGLLFFLLLGRVFQQKTYAALSFERDYKSYFPIAVTRLGGTGEEENVQVRELLPGDRILIRNEELIPADCILIKGEAAIDNSFVTGESEPVIKKSGDKIFAGGKQMGGALELEVMKSVEQSYLTQLWNHDVFNKQEEANFSNITDRISKYFTLAILLITAVAGIYWWQIDPGRAFQVISAVLIVACPCALALSAPFTMGNVLRIFGRNSLYVKNADTVELMGMQNTLVFDKTGTITEGQGTDVSYKGSPIAAEQRNRLKHVLRQSNHPLSRVLYQRFHGAEGPDAEITFFEEQAGKGISAHVDGNLYKIGSSTWVGTNSDSALNETRVYISENDELLGHYTFHNKYRKGLKQVFEKLSDSYGLHILSGDNAGERGILEEMLPTGTRMQFNQKPNDKLSFIDALRKKQKHVTMVGDGLNDAGALKQSSVGITVSENINSFSPACDAILDAREFENIPTFFKLAKQSLSVIKASILLSLIYNSVGLSFAISGNMSPVIAAILMPLSSISVVVFVTLATNLLSQKQGLK